MSMMQQDCTHPHTAGECARTEVAFGSCFRFSALREQPVAHRGMSVGAEIAADLLNSKAVSIGCSVALVRALSSCWQAPLFTLTFEPEGAACL